MKYAVIIPAQPTNKYSDFGDLASFGDTTLLEWKISQCKEVFSANNIYICSDSEEIRQIATNEGLRFIERKNGMSFNDVVEYAASSVSEENIVWVHTTCPFLGKNDFLQMIGEYEGDGSHDSLLAVSKKREYVYFQQKRLNFDRKFVDRDNIDPLFVVANGCYINKADRISESGSLYGDNPRLYELDYLSSMEIKDVNTFEISKDLISAYFKRDLHV